jgi:hypothetical protein
MFERRIEETIAYLLKETIADQETISSKQIFASEIPKSLKRMFDLDVDVWIEEERGRLLKSPHFRYDESEIQQVFEHIVLQAREYAVFTRTEYQQTLEKNVKLLFNYACRPQWTLVKYMFDDRENASTDEIVHGLKYFWDYEYYQIILGEYFEKKQLTVTNSRKFSELLEHVDQEVVRNFDSRKLAHLTEPIFELFAVGSSGEEKFVPIEALTIFFDDKKHNSIVERLDKEKEQREQVTLHDLVMLISEVDYTMSFDISSIVNQHVNNTDPIKPERHVTAGQDFEIPTVNTPEHVERDRKEIGEDEGDLDFVITEEEHSVTAHAYDSIPKMEDDEFLVDEDVTGYDELSEITLETEDEPLPEMEEDEILDDMLQDPQEFSEEEEISLGGEVEIIDDEDLDDDVVMSGTDETILEIEGELEEHDYIPDMSLEEMEDYALIEEVGNEEKSIVEDFEDFDEDPITLPSDDVPDLSLDDSLNDDDVDVREDDSELEIDWEKEAEEIPDMTLNDDEDERGTLTKDMLQDISQKEEESLQPAEELLGLLDLDDMDDTPSNKSQSDFDIPIIEDESPPLAGNNGQSAEAEESETTAVPAEEVIAQFGDINQQIADVDKKKYVKRLFQKNDEAFNRIMQVINGKPSWREASEYIDEIFIKHDVDMYSRVAVKFTDDIYKRYLTKK